MSYHLSNKILQSIFLSPTFSVFVSSPRDVTSSLKTTSRNTVIFTLSSQFLRLRGKTAHFIRCFYLDQCIHWYQGHANEQPCYRVPSDSVFHFVDWFSLFSRTHWSLSDLIARTVLRARQFTMAVFLLFLSYENIVFHSNLIPTMFFTCSTRVFPFCTYPVCRDRMTWFPEPQTDSYPIHIGGVCTGDESRAASTGVDIAWGTVGGLKAFSNTGGVLTWIISNKANG